MKIFKWIMLGVLMLSFQVNKAQDASPSPYSFFGMGDTSFKGTVENFGMGGLRFYADSIHYTINSPASLARLKFVSLSLGMGNNFMEVSDATASDWFSAHGVSYFSLGMPIGKNFGLGFGLVPVTSSGYKIKQTEADGSIYSYEGKGGNSRFFLAGAYQYKNFSFGLEYQYYFGYLDHQNNWFPYHSITYSKENNQVDFSGSAVKFSLAYHYPLQNATYIDLGANYRLSNQLNASYKKHLRLITVSVAGEQVAEEIENSNVPGSINLPSEIDFGVGYGKNNKWFVGAGYSMVGLKDFKNPFYDAGIITYENANEFHLGANYTPKHNSITKYWQRITYRIGFNYKNTGMVIHNEPVNDFGITFGLSLPSLRGISKFNLGVAVGQRGKIAPKLVKENYINLQISLSLNDKWFIKRKIN